MTVRNKSICCGITQAARQLGVSYCHLWKVLNGSYESPSLILKIRRQIPSLLRADVCKIDADRVISKYACQYKWDEYQGRYVKTITKKRKPG